MVPQPELLQALRRRKDEDHRLAGLMQTGVVEQEAQACSRLGEYVRKDDFRQRTVQLLGAVKPLCAVCDAQQVVTVDSHSHLVFDAEHKFVNDGSRAGLLSLRCQLSSLFLTVTSTEPSADLPDALQPSFDLTQRQ